MLIQAILIELVYFELNKGYNLSFVVLIYQVQKTFSLVFQKQYR